MEGIQVYALAGTVMRKVGSPVASFNDANLIIGLYPDMLRALKQPSPTAGFTWFAIRGSEMWARGADALWTEVDW